jgi:photosystem II PsbW protein
MAAAIASSAKLAQTCRVAKSTKTCRRVVAVRAQSNAQRIQSIKNKVATAAITLPAMIVASPAFALVDDRLNGDGTGKVLGINDPAVGFAILGVFLTIWSLWFNGQKDLGDFEDESDGLSL